MNTNRGREWFVSIGRGNVMGSTPSPYSTELKLSGQRGVEIIRSSIRLSSLNSRTIWLADRSILMNFLLLSATVGILGFVVPFGTFCIIALVALLVFAAVSV